MKKVTKVIMIFTIALIGMFLVGCTPAPAEQGLQTSTAVQLNPTLFDGLLIFLFTGATIYIFEKTGLDLKQYAIPIALTISTSLVAFAQGWVNAQPENLDPWILLGERVLLALFAGLGALRIFSRQPKTLLPE